MLFSTVLLSCQKKESTSYPVIARDPVPVYVHESRETIPEYTSIKGIRDVVLLHAGSFRFSCSTFNKPAFKEVYRILPYRFFDDIPLAGEKVKTFLKRSENNLSEKDIDRMKMDQGCLAGQINGIMTRICSPHTLPAIESPAFFLIDLDFISTFASEYRISKLRAIKNFFEALKSRNIHVIRADIVNGLKKGWISPLDISLEEELTELIKSPDILMNASPPELWSARDKADNMLGGGEGKLVLEYLKSPLAKYPADKALRLFGALALTKVEEYDNAYDDAEALCIEDKKYCYGLVFIGGLLSTAGKKEVSGRFIKRAGIQLQGEKISAKLYANHYRRYSLKYPIDRNGKE
jgi:hypothetical protein